jgi:hypothetical protein
MSEFRLAMSIGSAARRVVAAAPFLGPALSAFAQDTVPQVIELGLLRSLGTVTPSLQPIGRVRRREAPLMRSTDESTRT